MYNINILKAAYLNTQSGSFCLPLVMGDGILFLKNLYTRHLSLSMKTLHIKPILKAKKCGKSFSLSLVIVLFKRFQTGRWSSL